MKKLTAVTLALCLLMGLIPGAALAEGDGDDAFPTAETQVIGEADSDGDASPSTESRIIGEADSDDDAFPAPEFQVIGQPEPSDGEAYAIWKANAYGGASLLSGDDGGDLFNNDYLEVSVGPNGQFTMGTTGGDPNNGRDDYKLLLYGHPSWYTSETLFRIDGTDYFFQSDEAAPNHAGNSNETTRIIAGVEIKQILTPVENPMTGREDIVKIQYEYRNLTSETKEVGVRVMLDTMLGDNDGAPFRVDADQLRYEREYLGDEIPRYWLCFDYFDNPSVTAVGTLYTNSSERPDKVQFARWPNIIHAAWDYRVNGRYMDDSAVAVYFNPAFLNAGQRKTVTTYYGISESVYVPREGALSMRVVKPAVLNDNGNGDYDNNPFDVTAYVKNDGETALSNVKVNLTLNDQTLEILEGAEGKTIPTLSGGQEDAVRWTVRAKPQSETVTASYQVTGDYDDQKEQTVVNLETTLSAVKPLDCKVTFQMDDAEAEPIVIQVPHGGSLAESDIPAVPPKAGYVGKWNLEGVSLTNITEDITVTGTYAPMVQSVSVEPTSVTLTIGVTESAQLTATVLPEDAPDKSVEWVSYNEAVATVDADGVVTAKAVGAAMIEAKSKADNSKSAACAVTVEAVLTDIEVIPPNPWEMTQGEPLDITGLVVNALYSDGTKVPVTDYTLTGYDPNPEELNRETEYDEEGGEIPAPEYMDETLTVTYKDFSKTCVVRVNKLPPTLTDIHIRRTPTKRLNYKQGEKLNLDGMLVNFAYSDGKMSPAPVEFKDGVVPDGFVVTGYDPSRVGNQAITLSYKDPASNIVKSMQFYIRVLPSQSGQTAENNVLPPRVSIESAQGKKIVTLSSPLVNGADDSANTLPSGGDIYYTLDGDAPNASSTKYTGPFEVKRTTAVKAVTIVNGVQSPITSTQVYLPKAARPIVANLHHRNNQGLNRSITELEPGTLVSLISDTAGASIYYWIEGKLGSAEESRYGTSVYMKPEYADANGKVVLKAYAAKDGYQNSDYMTMTYHLNIPPVIPQTATVSVGRVNSRSGEDIAPTLSINATGTDKIRNFSVRILYNSGALEFQSVNAFLSGAEVFSSNVVTGRSGVLTLQYNGAAPLDAGEMCALNFRVIDSSENGSYDLTLDQSAVSVNMTDNVPMLYNFVNGMISITGAHNSQLAAATQIVDANGAPISSADALEAGGTFLANVTIALPEGSANADTATLSSAEDDTLRVLNVFLAIYDRDGFMVSMESWDIDVTDPMNLQSMRSIRVPRAAPGGKVKFIITSEDFTPSVEANTL